MSPVQPSGAEQVSVDLSALIATSQMPPAERQRLFHVLRELTNKSPEQWPSDNVRRLATSEPTYLLRFDDQVRVFFRPDGEGRIAIVDFVRQETLDRFFVTAPSGTPASPG